MPNWDNYYLSYDTIAFEDWQRECLQQDRIIEQQIREAEEEAENKKKYPLFFWKEGLE